MCNFAIIHFRCGHKNGLFLDCSLLADLNRLCESENRITLARYHFNGNCLDCHTRSCAARAELREERHMEEMECLQAKAKSKSGLGAEDLKRMMDTLERKAAVRERLELEKEAEMLEEIHAARAWARRHAGVVLHTLFEEGTDDQDRLDKLEEERSLLVTVLQTSV